MPHVLTEPVILSLVALATLIITTWNTWKTGKIQKKTDDIVVKADELNVKSTEIHGLVNSQMTSLKTELAAAKVEITELHDIVLKLSESKKK